MYWAEGMSKHEQLYYHYYQHVELIHRDCVEFYIHSREVRDDIVDVVEKQSVVVCEL